MICTHTSDTNERVCACTHPPPARVLTQYRFVRRAYHDDDDYTKRFTRIFTYDASPRHPLRPGVYRLYRLPSSFSLRLSERVSCDTRARSFTLTTSAALFYRVV